MEICCSFIQPGDFYQVLSAKASKAAWSQWLTVVTSLRFSTTGKWEEKKQRR
jgi:hypothetical protein